MFGFEIPASSTLVLIDVQHGFCGPRAGDIGARIATLLEQRGDEFERIVATQFVNVPDSPFRRYMNWHRMAESPETDLLDCVEQNATHFIVKQTYGATEQILRACADGPIFVAGVDLDVCVLDACRGLFDAGRDVRLIWPACASNAGRETERAMLTIARRTIGSSGILGA